MRDELQNAYGEYFKSTEKRIKILVDCYGFQDTSTKQLRMKHPLNIKAIKVDTSRWRGKNYQGYAYLSKKNKIVYNLLSS